jgi:leucyl-tRNA synthetase
MAPYTEQVLLCTGKADWASNLEDDGGDTATFVKGLKRVIGKGGEAFDVCTPPLAPTNSTRSGRGNRRGGQR